MLVNLALCGLKLLAGLAGRSQALVADSVHSLTDAVTDVAILIGARHWTAPPDTTHPYGHGRIETVVTLLIAISLMWAAVRIGFTAMHSLQQAPSGPPRAIALLAAALSILCKELLYRWTRREGTKIHSKAVVANAWHHRSDAFSSIPVAVAVATAILFPDWSFLDHIGAAVVSVLIVKTAYDIGRDALLELVDAGVSRDITAAVADIAATHHEVMEVHAVRARRVGARLHVDMHLLVAGDMQVSRGHRISDEVQRRLLESDLQIVDVVVHLEPDSENRQQAQDETRDRVGP